MPIELKMPALSPTMEEGTLAKWLVKEGDAVKSGDILAEIETDKATMEYEAIDEGVIRKIIIAEGTDGVPVGTVIVLIAEGGEASAPVADKAPEPAIVRSAPVAEQPRRAPRHDEGTKISPLAARIAEAKGIDLSAITGSGARGRILRADLLPSRPEPSATIAAAPPPAPHFEPPTGIPFETVKLSNMRKTIARRLTESKQQVPHIYLTVDVRLDALLALRARLNADLADRGVRLSVNDMIIRAQALALIECPEINVQFAGDVLHRFSRADISVAVSIPGGLITPIIAGADSKSLSAIAREMKDLATRARDGKLQPQDYQGGTASLSNLGMFGIRQFEAVINPPQAMILAVGEGAARVIAVDGAPVVATILSATGSFDHRAIDGADAARFMQAFKGLVESPFGLLA